MRRGITHIAPFSAQTSEPRGEKRLYGLLACTSLTASACGFESAPDGGAALAIGVRPDCEADTVVCDSVTAAAARGWLVRSVWGGEGGDTEIGRGGTGGIGVGVVWVAIGGEGVACI